MWNATHITQSIDLPPREVVEVASDLSRWAAGVGPDMTVTFRAGREFGILDHDVELGGQAFHNPLRVLENGDGSEVVFTLYRRPGVTDAEFEADRAAIRTDLATLRDICEDAHI
jgi:hypothetical protein